MCERITMSSLNKTWILDLDGTIVIHNGYKLYGKDRLIDGASDFLQKIPDTDMIIFLTSRGEEYRQITEDFLRENGIRWNYIIFEAPYGERILINDAKPSGLPMAFSVNTVRDQSMHTHFAIDKNL